MPSSKELSWSELTREQRQKAIQLKAAGRNYEEIERDLGLPLPLSRSARRKLRFHTSRVRTTVGETGEYNRLLAFLTDRPRTMREISTFLDRSEETVGKQIEALKRAGYNIIEEQGIEVSTTAMPSRKPPSKTLLDEPGGEVLFAAIGDTHFGSKYTQVSNLHAFLKAAYEKGVRHVFIAGDVVAGYRVYQGQFRDLYAVTADDQVDSAAYALPAYKGMEFWAIGGNHDAKIIRLGGPDPLALLEKIRPDFHHLGYDAVDLHLTERADLRLFHPSGGLPYAVSYKLQKSMEATAYEELQKAISTNENTRLRLVLAGHLHVSVMLPIGGVGGWQVGCFEGQTPYLKAKPLFPQIGGWVIRVRLSESGEIQYMCGEWYRFSEIEEDWKSYRRYPAERKPPAQPLFQLQLVAQ